MIVTFKRRAWNHFACDLSLKIRRFFPSLCQLELANQLINYKDLQLIFTIVLDCTVWNRSRTRPDATRFTRLLATRSVDNTRASELQNVCKASQFMRKLLSESIKSERSWINLWTFFSRRTMLFGVSRSIEQEMQLKLLAFKCHIGCFTIICKFDDHFMQIKATTKKVSNIFRFLIYTKINRELNLKRSGF